MRLGQRLMIIIILTFIGFCTLFLIISTYRFWDTAITAFEQRADYLADLAASSNADNVWNFNDVGIADFSRTLSKEDTLTALVFEIETSGNEATPLHFIGHQSGHGDIDQYGRNISEVAPPSAAFSKHVRRPILKDGAVLGAVNLYFSDVPILREAGQRANLFILTLLGLALVYSFIIYSVIDRLLLRSFKNLQNVALNITSNVSQFNMDFAQYHASNSGVFVTDMQIKQHSLLDVKRTDEIGDFSRAFMLLINSFAMLVEKETQYSDQVSSLNEALEDRIAVRTLELAASNQKLQASLDSLRQTQSQMVQQEKLASIGQLAAGVAHEINNPMGYVTSNLNRLGEYFADLLLLLDATDTEIQALPDELAGELRERLAVIKQSTDYEFLRTDLSDALADCQEGSRRVREIVQSLKDFSRVDNDMQWVAFSINDAINTTLKVVWNELKYHCVIHTDLQAQQLVKGNAGQLNQVIANLLVNAAHAIKETGQQGELVIKTYDRPASVIIEIADTGGGIPPEIQSRVFDPFFTTKPVGQGTGLGLNICYDIIVNKHHGLIALVSEVGKGTCFTITLPR